VHLLSGVLLPFPSKLTLIPSRLANASIAASGLGVSANAYGVYHWNSYRQTTARLYWEWLGWRRNSTAQVFANTADRIYRQCLWHKGEIIWCVKARLMICGSTFVVVRSYLEAVSNERRKVLCHTRLLRESLLAHGQDHKYADTKRQPVYFIHFLSPF
jgi:hypothetical protein